MIIKLFISEGKEILFDSVYKGNYALETMLFKVTEKFFGVNIRIKLEDLLKTRKENNND